MNKLIALSILTAAALPTAAHAQALPAAVIAVVDLNKVTNDCKACKTASATLKSQATALQAREKSLGDPLQSEAKSIQAAIDALSGKEPDAALQARVKAFQAKQQAGAAELQRRQGDLQRTQAFIQQQIAAKLGPVYEQVMIKRGANVLMEMGSTLASGAAIDVTADVTAGLNAVLPSISTTPPAQAAAPQGR
ncbi:MAG: OmpH family outer membrane protein [Sphingomicrobium sp.]